jgi:hypothetical protein
MKKAILTLLFLLSAQISYGEILEIYTWKPYPGRADQMLRDMNEAAEIHSDMGIGVTISALGLGTAQEIDYVLSYEDMKSWGQLKDDGLQNSEWNTFLERIRANPSGELVGSFSMQNHDASNTSNPFSEAGQVVAFFRWEPASGLAGAEALRQGFLTAKEIHESIGARVESYQVINGIEGVRDMMYLMIYDSYSHMADVNEAMQSNADWIEFQQSVDAQPSQAATLLRSGIAVMAASYD